MPAGVSRRSVLRWTVVGIASVLFFSAGALTLVAIFAAAADAGYARRPIVAGFSLLMHRHIEVAGPLHCRLLSSHPQLVADQVIIGNPQWMPDGVTARVRRLTLDLTIPGRGHLFRIDRLEMQGTTLDLVRDAAGVANWQQQPPHHGRPALPLIRNLSMRNVQADLDDERHHLKFHGIVSAIDGRSVDDPWLHINGVGQLNNSTVRFAIVGDPLIAAEADRPYHFTFMERSNDAQLSGRGSLNGAFRFKALQTTLDASGGNLHDLYVLAGISLINTGPFHLTGTLVRDGDTSRFEQLQATTGGSDIAGRVVVESADNRRKLDVDLSSTVLRLSDLGARAAQGEAAPAPAPLLLLSDAALKLPALRRGDASIQFHAQRLEAGRLTLRQVGARATIQQGVLSIEPFTAAVMDGSLQAHLRLDAQTDDPVDSLQLQLHDLQVGQLERRPKGAPRFDATLDAQLQIHGRGSSLHQLGASANGKITVAVSRGTLRTSLAELSGLDLRGLGLLLTGSERETAIRCGAATFDAVDGTLTSPNIVLDTDDVVIRGTGTIALDDESLAFRIAGHPRHTRLLRVRAPLLISGTLRHPAVGVETPHAMQLIARADPQDVDCEALLQSVGIAVTGTGAGQLSR